jgi:fucose permease
VRPSFWTLHGSFVLTGIVNTILGPVLPWLTTRWGLSDLAAGALFSAEFAGGLFGGVASGWIAARWGTGRTMGAGMILMALGVSASALGPLPLVAAGMFGAGVGLGFVIPSMNLLVVRLEPARAAAALAALNLSWGVGAMGWPIAVALLQPVVGGGPVLLVLAACLALAALPLGRMPVPASTGEHESRGYPARAGPTAVLLGALIVLYSGVEMAIGGWVTEYGRRITDAATAQGGQISAAMFWGGLTLGRAGIAVRLADRYANHALFTGLVLATGSVPLMLLSANGAWLAGSAICAGLGMAPVFPVTIAAVARRCPPRTASALIAAAGLGGATVPWIVGSVSDATGSLTLGLAVLFVLLLVLIAGQAARVSLDGRARRSSA